jgi:hypothetical protein
MAEFALQRAVAAVSFSSVGEHENWHGVDSRGFRCTAEGVLNDASGFDF